MNVLDIIGGASDEEYLHKRLSPRARRLLVLALATLEIAQATPEIPPDEGEYEFEGVKHAMNDYAGQLWALSLKEVSNVEVGV